MLYRWLLVLFLCVLAACSVRKPDYIYDSYSNNPGSYSDKLADEWRDNLTNNYNVNNVPLDNDFGYSSTYTPTAPSAPSSTYFVPVTPYNPYAPPPTSIPTDNDTVYSYPKYDGDQDNNYYPITPPPVVYTQPNPYRPPVTVTPNPVLPQPSSSPSMPYPSDNDSENLFYPLYYDD